MEKYSNTILNRQGKPVVGALVTVTTYPGNQPATIYAADGGAPVQSVTSDDTGRFAFYAADGHYNLSITGKDIKPVTISDVVLDDPSGEASLAALSADTGADLVRGTWFGGIKAAVSQLGSSIGTSLIGFVAHGRDTVVSLQSQLRGDGTEAPVRRGFWTSDASGANIHRLRDRVFIGEAVKHTGRGTAPYGDTWLATKVATWPEKNAQALILSSEEKIGLLTGVQATNASGASAIGLASFSYNERTNGTARAMYADVTHSGPAGASYGLEIAVNNCGTDVQTNAYSLPGGSIGLHMTPEGGSNYTLGDADAPATVATAPSTVALNIGAGSGGTANKRWNLGIRFGSNALTGSDGVTGSAIAIGMARGHTIEWRASNTITGASIRSDVTAVADQDVGLLFENNAVSVKGAAMGPTVAKFNATASAANYVGLTNAIAGGYPIIKPDGSDTNIGLFIDSKGNAPLRLRTNGGLAEQLRVSHVASAVNFLNVVGSIAGAPPQIGSAGTDTDIDLLLQPKGTGKVKFGALTATADAPITGYIEIKDTSGVVRRLAVIS